MENIGWLIGIIVFIGITIIYIKEIKKEHKDNWDDFDDLVF